MKHASLFGAVVFTASAVHASLNPSQTLNPATSLARSASIRARQDVDETTAEHCGTDNAGYDWWCEDPQTTCCFGTDIWQCAPITAQECCATGYYCEAGTFCYLLNETQEQYCLTEDEVAQVQQGGGSGAEDEEDDSTSGGGGGGGARVKFTPTKPASAAAAAQTFSSKSGGSKKKGGSGGGSSDDDSKGGVGKVGAGGVMAGLVAFGAVLAVGA
ncbi:hypothetical protein jhhlp_008719 [Lomentospora prolificans]|uniref:Uncharacterized protein n=1 Tax=Lomentospora prolificans TaxID=41688 RepID=A0A2N3MYW2_9PEZI|nr:hypothetical protein jhhlp_008719 [Lomentospora prolificans]